MQHHTKTVTPLSQTAEALLKDAFETQQHIEDKKKELELLEGHLANVINGLVAHDIHEAGNYELYEKIRVTRKVNVERFKEKYPAIYDQIREKEIERAKLSAGKTILIKDAEYLLGKEQIDPICDLISTTTRVVLKKELE